MCHLRLGCTQVFSRVGVFLEGLEALGGFSMSTRSFEVRLVRSPMGLFWRQGHAPGCSRIGMPFGFVVSGDKALDQQPQLPDPVCLARALAADPRRHAGRAGESRQAACLAQLLSTVLWVGHSTGAPPLHHKPDTRTPGRVAPSLQ